MQLTSLDFHTAILDPGSHGFSRISFADASYGRIHDFLMDEAALLDDNRHLEWLELLSEDIVYRMPVRRTLNRKDGYEFSRDSFFFDDDFESLKVRARRNAEIKSAFDRDPPPRIRRIVGNIRVWQVSASDRYLANSSIIVTRNRFDDVESELITARRQDVVEVQAGKVELNTRLVLVDHAVMGVWANAFL